MEVVLTYVPNVNGRYSGVLILKVNRPDVLLPNGYCSSVLIVNMRQVITEVILVSLLLTDVILVFLTEFKQNLLAVLKIHYPCIEKFI